MENTTYEWIISAMECKIKEGTLDNIVALVHWRLNASRDGKTAETYAVTTMPEPSGIDFIPYNQLTKVQVVDWLVNVLSTIPEAIDGVSQQSQMELIYEDLNENLFSQLNPIIFTDTLPFKN